MKDQVGIDVAAIIRRRRIELHYSEFGLGGGASPLGSVAARTPDQAARMPFYGVWGAYRGSSDPWAPPQVSGGVSLRHMAGCVLQADLYCT